MTSNRLAVLSESHCQGKAGLVEDEWQAYLSTVASISQKEYIDTSVLRTFYGIDNVTRAQTMTQKNEKGENEWRLSKTANKDKGKNKDEDEDEDEKQGQ